LVAVTGYGQWEDKERARAAGFDHHLVKPINLTEITALIVSLGHETSIKNASR
jgi:CheY-like chemotaxis protein